MTGRPRRLVVGLLLGLAAVGAWIVVGQPRAARLAADFTIDYSAGLLVREGRFDAPYQQPALAETMHRAAPQSAIDPRLPFNKPLAAALPYAALSLLPLDLAFRFWQAIDVLALLGSLILLHKRWPLGRTSGAWALLGTVAAVPVWAALTEGQPTPLLLLGAAHLLWASDRRPITPWLPLVAAGGGALLAVKPQYLPPYLLILLAARRPLLLTGGIAGGALVLMSPLLGGPSTLLAMVHNALLANEVVSIRADESWVGVLAAVAPLTIASLVGVFLSLAALIGLSWLAWRKTIDITIYSALVGMVAVLLSPHALPHDLVILGAPAWLSFALWRGGMLPNPVFGWILVDLALVIDLRGIGVPVAVLTLTGMLVWAALQLRQRLPNDLSQQPLSLAG